MKISPSIYDKLRRFLMYFGVARAVLILTIASVLTSVGLTYVMSRFVTGGMDSTGLWISILVPAIIAPVFSFIHLSLAYELELTKEKLQQLAITDDLTRAFNRRHFIELANRELDRSVRHKHPLSFILFDIDDFKKINDSFGHGCGDQALAWISSLCSSQLRQHDVFARYGGEEFIIMLPETNEREAMVVAERMRQTVDSTPFDCPESNLALTISIGVATFLTEGMTLEALLKRADEALYSAKRAGKNRVSLFEM